MGRVSGCYSSAIPEIDEMINRTIFEETGMTTREWEKRTESLPTSCPNLGNLYHMRETEPKLLAKVPPMPEALRITNGKETITLDNVLTAKAKTKIPFTFNQPMYKCNHEELNRDLLLKLIKYVVGLGVALVDENILRLFNLFICGQTDEKTKQTNKFGDFVATKTGNIMLFKNYSGLDQKEFGIGVKEGEKSKPYKGM